MERSSGGVLYWRYLIILSTVFGISLQHKMPAKYIFRSDKEWHKKAPRRGADLPA
jgi:hypothetical protein